LPALANIDGTLLAPAEARISVLDRGFLSGDQVYEVLRTYGLRPFELDAHLARLARSAARIALPLPWDGERTAREVARTLAGARGVAPPAEGEAPWNRNERTVRVVMTRGAGEAGAALGVDPGPRAIVLVQPLRGPPASAYREGVRCILARARAPRGDPQAKTGRHLAEAVAGEEARAAGAHEALLVDGRGLVTEGASSSLFVVKAGRIETPPLDVGILAGVTRHLVLGLARRAGIEVAELPLETQDLAEADEIFITSTTREVLPVTVLGVAPVGAGRVGPVTTRVHALFRAQADAAAEAR